MSEEEGSMSHQLSLVVSILTKKRVTSALGFRKKTLQVVA